MSEETNTFPTETPSQESPSEEPFVELDLEQVPDTDIVFECPYCKKSLSIDRRGAGLVISCTACHQLITVPIPEGMEVAEIDTEDDLKTQVIVLRRSLARAEARIAELEVLLNQYQSEE